MRNSLSLCLSACVALMLLGLGLPALLVAGLEGSASCQGTDVLSLQEWLIGYGSAHLGLLAAVGLCGLLGGYCVEQGIMTALLSMILWIVFQTAWFVVGLVILIRGHHECVTTGSSLGVMTFVALVFHGGLVRLLVETARQWLQGEE